MLDEAAVRELAVGLALLGGEALRVVLPSDEGFGLVSCCGAADAGAAPARREDEAPVGAFLSGVLDLSFSAVLLGWARDDVAPPPDPEPFIRPR